MKQLTGITVQECTASQISTAVSKPCNGLKSTVSLDASEPTTFLFNLSDVSGYDINNEGALVLTFTDKSTLIIPNFQELAAANYTVKLEDGTVVQFADLIEDAGKSEGEGGKVAGLDDVGAIGVTELGFNQSDVKSVETADGRIIFLLKDGTEKVVLLENGDKTVLQFADGSTMVPGQIENKFASAEEFAKVEPAAGEQAAVKKAAQAQGEQLAQLSPEDLAAIEPAAGGAAAGGGGNANFGSAIDRSTIGSVADVGPIGPTSLSFGIPEPQPLLPFAGTPAPANIVVFPNPPAVDGVDKQVLEDNSIQLTVSGSSSTNDGSEYITVEIIGIPPTWTITDIANGVYDSTTQTWTIILPPGENFNGGPTIQPPLNSDVDLPLEVVVTTTNTSSGLSTSSTDNFTVIVDAVADDPNFNVANITVAEDNNAPINLSASVTDTDGSESIVSYTISALPDGFTLSAGTKNADGSYTLTPAQITGLVITPPEHYSGSINITASVTIYDTPTDTDFDDTNNTRTETLPIVVTWTPVADAPIMSSGVNQVYEDGSVTLATSATLVDRDGSESMVVEIVGIPSSWTITDLKGGTYDAATQTWTINVPAGQDFNGGPTIAPPANSDIDLPLTLRATTTDGTSTAVSTTPFTVIVDAVADNVNLTATGGTGNMNSTIALNIATSLKDTDGSERIDSVTITGIPANVTLSAGTKNADGSYTLTVAQLTGLTATSTNNYFGTINATVTVNSSERVAVDSDFDNTNNTAVTSVPLNIVFNPNVTPPVIEVNNAGPNNAADGQTYEDTSVFIPVTVTGQGTDQETMVVTISNLPAGWTIDASGLTGGTPVINGSTITINLPANTNLGGGIRFTPPLNSDVDSPSITVSATSTEPASGLTATSSEQFVVEVDAVADVPNLTASAATGNEDSPIALTIASSLKDTDGSEVLSLKITGVPTGATLSAGTKNADGSYTLTPAQLAGLTITPPTNFSGTINLTVTATATETNLSGEELTLANNVASVSQNLVVTVNPVADDPALTINNAQVYEDQSVTLSVQAAPTDPSESITVTIGNLQGWTVTALNGGTYNAATGVWSITLPAGQSFNGGPTVAPNADSDVNRALPVTVTSTDGTDTEVKTGTLNVVVDAVADNVNLSAAGGSGEYNSSVNLSIATSLRDVDGSEEITSVRITGIPANVTLSAGTKNADGSYTLTVAQLAGLKATSNGYVGSFTGTVTVNSRETVTDTDFDLTNNTATRNANFTVTFDLDTNPPIITVNTNGNDAQVYEDNSVLVPISVVGQGTDQETMVVTIGNLPAGWGIDFSGLTGGTAVRTGDTITVTLPANTDLGGAIRFTPPADSDVNSPSITVSAVATEPATGETASSSDNFAVIVDAVADNVNLSATGGSGVANTAVNLNIATSLKDVDGSERIDSITITGVPASVTLSAGTKNADGSYTLTTAQLAGLKATSNGYIGSFTATVRVNSSERVTDTDFDLTNNTAVNSATFNVTFTPPATPPVIEVNNAGPNAAADGQVYEDNSVFVPITVTGQGTDQETMVVTISNLPAGWGVDYSGLTGGTPVAGPAGTITINLPANTNLGGGIRFTPPANSDVDSPNITVSAVATEPASNQTASSSEVFNVDVDAVADGVNLSASGGTGAINTAVNLNIATSLKDTDGSEKIDSITITGVPANVTLSAGTKNADGSWSLTQAQLTGLKATSNGYFGNFTATVRVNSSEKVTDTDFDLTNNTASNTTTFNVSFTATVTPPVIEVNNAGPNAAADGQTYEDTAVFVPITVTGQGSAQETMVVTISGLPTGWTIDTSGLTGGTVVRTGGTVTVTLPANTDLGGGIRFTPPVNSDVDSPTITVSATVTEPASGLTATSSQQFVVEVDAVADAPNLTASAASGNEDSPIALTIASSLKDTDGSEVLSLRINGVPAGATLSAGTKNADGSWSLTPAQLAGLKLNPPANFSGTITLTVIATATETNLSGEELTLANNVATTQVNVTVTVNPVADVPTLTVNNAQVYEDQTVTLNVKAAPTDPSETITVTIGNLQGWTVTALNGGTYNAATGVWSITLPAGQAFDGGPTVRPNQDSDVNRDLPVTVTSKDGSDTEVVNGTLTVVVDAVADNVNLSAAGGSGKQGDSVGVNIATSLKDVDGSEEITSVRITGIPNGVTLSAGTKNADGSWSLTQGQLAGLKVNGGSYTGSFTATVTVASREKVTDTDFDLTNNTASNSANFTVSFDVITKPPVITVNTNGNDAQVYEDNSVFVPISVVGQGTNQETMVVTISNLPAGWGIDHSGLTGGTVVRSGTTITVTLPANTDLGGGIRFTPPANSDVNSPDIRVTAVATEPSTGNTASSTDDFVVIVDAVADGVNLSASGGTGAMNTSVNVSIATSLKDTDGSERIDSVRITGVPANVTLSAGTKNADGSWTLTTGQLAGLKATSNGYTGTFNATVTVLSSERVTDTDFDLTNNNASNSTNFSVTFNNVPQGPFVTIDTSKDCVFEDTVTVLPFSANFTGGNGDEVLTVTVTGLPTSGGWVVNTGGVGTYNASTGTWTITLPAGTTSFTNTTLTVKPPANSDVDYNGINVTASLRDPDNGNKVTTDTKAMPLEVDAVADGVTVATTKVTSYFFDTDIKTTGGVKTVPFAANFSYTHLDADGSERITKIEAVGANSQYVKDLYINSEGQLCGTFTWTGTLPANFSVNIQITTYDNPTDSDCTLTNNTIVQTFPLQFETVMIHTPLALDLDGDGLNLVAMSAGTTFDLNGDGHKEKTAWLSGKDAFLALDLDGDGVINNGNELFGNDANHADGFAKLASYDSNGDGVIDANDEVYNSLKLWTDLNGDGISQEDELFSLLDKGIASLNLVSQKSFDEHGADYGVVTAKSTFTTVDGQVHDLYDMAFAVSHDDALSTAINEFVNQPGASDDADAGPRVDPNGHETWSGPEHVAIDEVVAQIDETAKGNG